MVRFLFCIILFLACSSFPARAQTDSLGGKELREVQIFGQPAIRFASGSRVTSIDTTFLQVNNAGSLADVLQFRTPVYIKSYGAGMLATAAFRGTSASQTAVLWHGFNINLPTLGLSDFSIIPVNNFGKVEIQHGSSGALYGTGAVGGAISLSSPVTQALGLRLRAQQDIASYNRYYTSLGGSYGTKNIALQTNIYQNHSLNNFKYRNNTKAHNPTERQKNAAISQQGLTQDIDWKLNEQNTISVRGWYTQSENETQPNLVAANTHARIGHENLRLMSAWEHKSVLGNSVIKGAYFRDRINYHDDLTNSDTKVNTYQAQAEHQVHLHEKLNLKAGGEVQYFDADVSGYGMPVTETRSAVFGWLRYDVLPVLHISTNVRQSFITGYNPPLTPAAGINLIVLNRSQNTLVAKGAISRGYRVPTLNDRFWPTGNANLTPETSWNYESGLQYNFITNQLHFTTEATLYRLEVDNWIQWTPDITGQWRPQNLKKVRSQGLELSADAAYHLDNYKITAGGNYAFTNTEQQKSNLPSYEPLQMQLVYVPKHTASGYSTLHYKMWLATLNLNFTGYRYTNAEHTQWLPSFALLNLDAGKSFTWQQYKFQVIGKINNATNSSYQAVEYYAMPLRNYALSLRFNLQ